MEAEAINIEGSPHSAYEAFVKVHDCFANSRGRGPARLQKPVGPAELCETENGVKTVEEPACTLLSDLRLYPHKVRFRFLTDLLLTFGIVSWRLYRRHCEEELLG